MGVSPNGRFRREYPMKTDDFGGTPILGNPHLLWIRLLHLWILPVPGAGVFDLVGQILHAAIAETNVLAKDTRRIQNDQGMTNPWLNECITE